MAIASPLSLPGFSQPTVPLLWKHVVCDGSSSSWTMFWLLLGLYLGQCSWRKARSEISRLCELQHPQAVTKAQFSTHVPLPCFCHQKWGSLPTGPLHPMLLLSFGLLSLTGFFYFEG